MQSEPYCKLKLLKNTENIPCFLLHLLEITHGFAAQVKKIHTACYMFFCAEIVHSSKTLHIFRQCTSTPSPNIIRVHFWPIIKPEKHWLFQKYCSSILKQVEEHQSSKSYSKHNFKQGSLHFLHLTFVLDIVNHRENPNPNLIETSRQKLLKLHYEIPLMSQNINLGYGVYERLDLFIWENYCFIPCLSHMSLIHLKSPR